MIADPDNLMPKPPAGLLSLTVPDLLRRRAEAWPHRLALSARSARGYRDRLSYRQLVQRMEALARALASLGLRSGDRVAVLLGNEAGRESILTALGVVAVGAAVAPLNVRYAQEELAHALELVEPRIIVTTPERSAGIHQLWPPAMILAVADNEGGSECATPWPEPEQEPPGLQPSGPRSAEQLACLLFTSGTTARSKAVMHSHRTMIASGLCCGTALGLASGDLYQGAFPFFTSSALNLGCMSSWVSEAGFVFEEPLYNERSLRLV